jgi:spore coat polysaccharide biosynthesis protein SpsF (cytidylyltransferase family)
MVKCAWLIFIRSSSTRLPGKAYLKLGNNIMFEHIVLNLMHDGVNISDIFLCTTRSPADDKLQKIAFQLGIKVIRGEEAEPIKRYWDNLYIWKDYDYISRVNGDSPMYIARLGLEALERIDNLNSLPDVITSIRGGKRNFPSGLSLEMYKAQHLNALLSEHQEYCCREHMSELIGLSENRGGQILDVMPHSSILDEYNCKLTIDTYDDYCFINDLVETERFQDFLDYFRAIQLSFERFN